MKYVMNPDIKCSNCRFFRESAEKYAHRHSCCKNAPSPIAMVSSYFANGQLNAPMIKTTVETHWPQVTTTDWCGEFQPAETQEGTLTPNSQSPVNPDDPYDYPHLKITVTSKDGTSLLLPLNYTADVVYIAEINGLHERYDTHDCQCILNRLYNEGLVMECTERFKDFDGTFQTQTMYRAIEP